MLLLSGLLAVSTVSATAAETRETRLSQNLTSTERSAAGFSRLSSDQVAVLDALFRRDAAAQLTPRRSDAPPLAARFSQRLTADERLTSGLTLLTEAELSQLDAFADRVSTALNARALLTPVASSYIPVSVRTRVAEAKIAPEIHGSFTLGMGFGKGYSERFGGMTLTYDDPEHNLAVSFSYTESRIKGAIPYCVRDPLLDENRFSRFDP